MTGGVCEFGRLGDGLSMAGAGTSREIELSSGARIGLGVYGAERGFPVLALHGTPASRLMFSIADEKARAMGLTLYCPERFGYGLSSRPARVNEPDYVSRTTDAFVEVADRLGLSSFAILGISGGTVYAVSLASRLGRHVSALVLASPLGPVSGVPDDVSRAFLWRHRALFGAPRFVPWLLRFGAGVALRLFHAAPEMFAHRFASSLGPADEAVLSKVRARESLIAMTREAVRDGVYGALADVSVFSRAWDVDFEAIGAPVALAYGSADKLAPVAAARLLGDLIPGCEVERRDGDGHFWIYEHIDHVLSTVVRLSGQAPAAR